MGAVSAGCLASQGHSVVGVDPSAVKLDLIGGGKSPVVEKDLDVKIREAVGEGRLRATHDAIEAVHATDMSLVCVGTPSKANGDLDLSHIATVSQQIGEAIATKPGRHTVVIRSTILPGTMRHLVIPALEAASGRRAGADFGIGNNPEFLREGSAVDDFYNPPKTVIGALDDQTAELVSSLYEGIPGPFIRTSLEVGEMVKYSDNVWHALKVAFGNEIGTTCKALGIDSHAVMDIFVQDTKLNLSPYYLKPGFAFGGSCLPKDVRALTYRARTLDLDLPVLNSIIASNERQVNRGYQMIARHNRRRVTFLGISFKAGTDDLRESPILDLVERLLGKGFDVRIYDKNVHLSKLVGANRDFLLKVIPHVSCLLIDNIEGALTHGEVIVVGTRDPDFMQIVERLTPEQILVDLVRVESREKLNGQYDGINW